MEFRQTLVTFKEWLETSGAIIQPPSNQWEVIRYKARATEDADEKKVSTYVAYKKNDGRITFMGSTFHHWNLYRAGKPSSIATSSMKAPLGEREDGYASMLV